jgi:hypothetical protein
MRPLTSSSQALHREFEAQRDAVLTSSADVDEMYDLLAFYGQAVPTGDQVHTCLHAVHMPEYLGVGFEAAWVHTAVVLADQA